MDEILPVLASFSLDADKLDSKIQSESADDDPAQMALSQQPILSAIFGHLELEDIKACSLVNQTWNDATYSKLFSSIKIINEEANSSFTIEEFRRIFKEHGRVIRKLILDKVKFTDGGQDKLMYCIQKNVTANLASLIIISDCHESHLTPICLRLDLLTGLKCLRLDSVSFNITLHVLLSNRPFRPNDLKLKGVIVTPAQLLLNDFIDFGVAQEVEIDQVYIAGSLIEYVSIGLDMSEEITVDILKLNRVIIKNPEHLNWKYSQTVELGFLLSDENLPLSISLQRVN